jgi:hypothetical protein
MRRVSAIAALAAALFLALGGSSASVFTAGDGVIHTSDGIVLAHNGVVHTNN